MPRVFSRFKNKKITIDGILFDSMDEGTRYLELKTLEKAGAIKNLQLQVPFAIIPSVFLGGRKKPTAKYISDFTYTDNREDGLFVVEDVKSDFTRKEPVYRLKMHLMKHVHGIDVAEIIICKKKKI